MGDDIEMRYYGKFHTPPTFDMLYKLPGILESKGICYHFYEDEMDMPRMEVISRELFEWIRGEVE